MLHELLAATGSTPGDTLMVGDSQWDLLMAHAASIRSVAVSYGTQPIDTLRAHNPWATIDAFGELLDLLDLD
jgi:phosphoglycolate phosphatase